MSENKQLETGQNTIRPIPPAPISAELIKALEDFDQFIIEAGLDIISPYSIGIPRK